MAEIKSKINQVRWNFDKMGKFNKLYIYLVMLTFASISDEYVFFLDNDW